jgi:S1-C subfamily serine protease
MMGEVMKILAMFGGIKPNYDVKPRGLLGAELATDGTVKSVLPGGPAEKAGLKAGDRIQTVKGGSVRSPEALLEAMKKLPEGASVKLEIKRGEDTKSITVELGKGL